MEKLFFACALVLFGLSAHAQNTDNLLNKYIGVKNALVNSDSKTASLAINTFYESLKSEGNFSQKDELLKATEKFIRVSGIEKQRAAFSDLSTAMWKLIENSGKLSQVVYYDYCPMKKSYWLSNEKEIRNPYYGSSMLSCGKVEKTKK